MSNLVTVSEKKRVSLSGLPILDEIIKYTKNDYGDKKNMGRIALIYIHHPLKTSINLLNAVIFLGIKPYNIFVLGKHYSESLDVVNEIVSMGVNYQKSSKQLGIGNFAETFSSDIKQLWDLFFRSVSQNVDSIIIADHGGYVLSSIPERATAAYKVIGLEKTSGGLARGKSPGFPVINVAGSNAKKELESPLIANAIMNKLEKRMGKIKPGKICGIVGYGAIGQSLAKKLIEMGYFVFVCDLNISASLRVDHAINIITEIKELLNISDYIFGCTGEDITSNIKDFDSVPNKICLISCSSGDVEFNCLLQKINEDYGKRKKIIDSLDDLFLETEGGGEISILRGGFPINFDDSGESVPANDIQLTRALVLFGILQCVDMLMSIEEYSLLELCELKEEFQKMTLTLWLKEKGDQC